MGRYPFFTLIEPYLADHSGVLGKKTRDDRRDKLKWLGRLLVEMRVRKTISTTNPRKLTKRDALAIVAELSNKGWKQNYLVMTISALRNFVSYCGNPTFDELARLKLLPKPSEPAIRSLSENELKAIRDGAEGIKGWPGEVARFIAAIYAGSGARASELRLAKRMDLSTESWTIKIRNPKGKGRYADERTIPILPEGRQATIRFLQARETELKKIGAAETEPLIPCTKGGRARYYSKGGFERIKSSMEKASGVRFRIKDYRSTFCQRNIDLDPTLLIPTSRTLGHKSTVTTEKYYGRIAESPAIALIQRAWENKAIAEAPKPQFPLIDHKEWLPGYG